MTIQKLKRHRKKSKECHWVPDTPIHCDLSNRVLQWQSIQINIYIYKVTNRWLNVLSNWHLIKYISKKIFPFDIFTTFFYRDDIKKQCVPLDVLIRCQMAHHSIIIITGMMKSFLICHILGSNVIRTWLR